MMNVHERLIFVFFELFFHLLLHNDCSLLSHAWKICNCCCCLRLRSLFMYNAVCERGFFVVFFVWRVKCLTNLCVFVSALFFFLSFCLYLFVLLCLCVLVVIDSLGDSKLCLEPFVLILWLSFRFAAALFYWHSSEIFIFFSFFFFFIIIIFFAIKYNNQIRYWTFFFRVLSYSMSTLYKIGTFS